VAIKKCPYCKAFIEEDSEFCSNCGTKLIFPEDEDIEEEIPGERIIELEEQEASKSYSSEPPEDIDLSESDETGIRLKDSLPEELDLSSVNAPSSPDKDTPDSGRKENEEKEEAADEDTQETEKTKEEESGDYVELDEEAVDDEEEKEEEELFGPSADTPPPKGISPFDGIPELEDEQEPENETEDRKKHKSASPKTGSWLFPEESSPAMAEEEESAEQEDTSDSADKEKEEIERFLDSLKKERQEIKARIKNVEGDLPPWAEKMKSPAPRRGEEEEEYEDIPAEGEIREADDSMDTREALDIPAAEESTGETGEEIDIKPEINMEETPSYTGYDQGMLFGSEQEDASRKRFGLFSFLKMPRHLKSRLFDVVLIAVLWLAALWIAAYLTQTPVFRLFAEAVLPALGFFVILIAVYFGLFLVFLRETLGDLLFSKED
jgi:hypothetical protein